MIAPRAKVFAVCTVEIALHRHVIDRDVWIESEIASRDLEQVPQICEHVGGLYIVLHDWGLTIELQLIYVNGILVILLWVDI